jgi:hypothetical protein
MSATPSGAARGARGLVEFCTRRRETVAMVTLTF